MEPLFVTECKFDNKSYYEMVPILRKKALSKFSYIYTCHNPYYDILSCSLGNVRIS